MWCQVPLTASSFRIYVKDFSRKRYFGSELRRWQWYFLDVMREMIFNENFLAANGKMLEWNVIVIGCIIQFEKSSEDRKRFA